MNSTTISTPTRTPAPPLSMPDQPATREIPLRNRKGEVIGHTIVDAEDYAELSKYRWCDNGQGYVVRQVRNPDGARTMVRMHRQILDAPGGMQVDHRDGNRLNNTRSNLRLATPTQNAGNQRPVEGSSSVFKGVVWHKRDRKWQAGIRLDGKYRYLGTFSSEIDAALAYDAAAIEHFGAFARPNFPLDTSSSAEVAA